MADDEGIYGKPLPGSPGWLTAGQIQDRLKRELKGLDLSPYPLRTRSKVVKQEVCKALGYPVPATFRKTHPRFPVQDLEVCTQKSNNVQIWNQDEISPATRYAFVRPNEGNIVETVRVITGAELAKLDKTGKLTTKYQAAYREKAGASRLLSGDTSRAKKLHAKSPGSVNLRDRHPTEDPAVGEVLPIDEVFRRLARLSGTVIEDGGFDQERAGGAELHKAVCRALGYAKYSDKGGFPDVPHQLVEVKRQTSPTIDLGLVLPSDTTPIPDFADTGIRHCDVRYAVFYGERLSKNSGIRLHLLLLCNGEEFFDHFTQFSGKVINKKFQIPLPHDFFEDT